MPLTHFPLFPLSGKLSQLRNLTELLCEPETFNSMKKICQKSNMNFGDLCGKSVFHVRLLEAAEFGTKIITSLLYRDNILLKKMGDLLTGDPNKINSNMDR